MINKLDEITKNLIKEKNALDTVERQMALTKAEIFISVLGQVTNQDAREAQVTIMLETDHREELDRLYDLRGKVRELTLTRECLIERLKERRAASMGIEYGKTLF